MAKGQGYRARLSKRIHRLFRSRRASSRRSSTGGQAAPPATSHASPRAIAPHSVAAHPPTDRPPVLPEPRSSPLSLGDQPGTKPKKLQKRRPSEESEPSLRDQERLAHVVGDIHGQLQTPDVIDGYDDDEDDDYGRTPTRETSYPFGNGAGVGRGSSGRGSGQYGGGRHSSDSRTSPGRTSGRFVGAQHPAVHPLQAQPAPRSPPRGLSAGAIPMALPLSDGSLHQRRRSKSSGESSGGSSGRHRGKMTPYDQLHNNNNTAQDENKNRNSNGTYDYLNGAGHDWSNRHSPRGSSHKSSSSTSSASPSRSSYSGTAHLAPTRSRSSRHATPPDRHSTRSLSWGPLSKHGRSRDGHGADSDAPELPGFPGVSARDTETVDYRVSTRDAVVHEHIRPRVHTIYEPQRTRSIHYHDHYTLVQPIIDPVPRVMPERHWLQDGETGETTLITAEIGRALDLEGATTAKRHTRKAAPAADGGRSVYV